MSEERRISPVVVNKGIQTYRNFAPLRKPWANPRCRTATNLMCVFVFCCYDYTDSTIYWMCMRILVMNDTFIRDLLKISFPRHVTVAIVNRCFNVRLCQIVACWWDLSLACCRLLFLFTVPWEPEWLFDICLHVVSVCFCVCTKFNCRGCLSAHCVVWWQSVPWSCHDGVVLEQF